MNKWHNICLVCLVFGMTQGWQKQHRMRTISNWNCGDFLVRKKNIFWRMYLMQSIFFGFFSTFEMKGKFYFAISRWRTKTEGKNSMNLTLKRKSNWLTDFHREYNLLLLFALIYWEIAHNSRLFVQNKAARNPNNPRTLNICFSFFFGRMKLAYRRNKFSFHYQFDAISMFSMFS